MLPAIASSTAALSRTEHILSERHIAFYRERAKGGAGLMITEQQGAYPYLGPLRGRL
jgi:2,4-dienoyl-CoA reductase-like NADH-dependent reductase (Old Yellow Enzyme family)